MTRVASFLCIVVGCTPTTERHPDISATSECDGCTIDFEIVWSTDTSEENVLGTGWPLEVGGELWMVGEHFGHAIATFPLDGEASTLVERPGDGPGEFRQIVGGQVSESGETIVLVQDSRITYLTPELQVLHTVPNPVPRPVGILLLPDGNLLIANPRLRLPLAAAGYALHVLAQDGSYSGSFRTAASESTGGRWPLADSDSNRIWVVEPGNDGFTAELWDIRSRARVRAFEINPEWWVGEITNPLDYEQGRRNVAVPLPTGTVGAWESEGLLWIALRHFDQSASSEYTYDQVDKWFDGVLLALDPVSGVILASLVVDEFILGFTNRGRLALYREDPNGQPQLLLADIHLRRSAQQASESAT